MPIWDEGDSVISQPLSSGAEVSGRRVDAFLKAEGIVCGYGGVPVIHDVTVRVGCGEVVLVMGPNGAGKSTLVKAITGKLPLLAGTVYLEDEDLSGLREDQRAARGIGYVPQSQDVFFPLSVAENLAMGGYRLTKALALDRIAELYDQFPQLTPLRRRNARTLSGGERKLVGIARALVARPRLLILDEPTANLAPTIAGNILHDVVERLASEGCAVLLIEQRVRLALEVCTWGYVLTSGRSRLEASADELRGMEDLSSLFLGSAAPAPSGAHSRRMR